MHLFIYFYIRKNKFGQSLARIKILQATTVTTCKKRQGVDLRLSKLSSKYNHYVKFHVLISKHLDLHVNVLYKTRNYKYYIQTVKYFSHIHICTSHFLLRSSIFRPTVILQPYWPFSTCRTKFCDTAIDAILHSTTWSL